LQQAPQSAAEFGDRIQDSFVQIGAFVPSLLGALVILFAGYLLAKLAQRATGRVLRRLHLNEALERGGVLHAVERTGASVNPARVVADLVFWLVMFGVLLIAANALGLRSLAEVFGELVSYIPSVIAAVVIIIVGIVLGNFVGGLVQASAGTIHGGPTLARVGRVGVIVIAVFMALQELGVATEIVTTAFASLFGAVALALALSFGLGNRELAGEVTREWYERYRAEKAAIEREAALEAAEEEAALAAPPTRTRSTPFFGSRAVAPPGSAGGGGEQQGGTPA
jgi:small-conductance mechanosensitive channel